MFDGSLKRGTLVYFSGWQPISLLQLQSNKHASSTQANKDADCLEARERHRGIECRRHLLRHKSIATPSGHASTSNNSEANLFIAGADVVGDITHVNPAVCFAHVFKVKRFGVGLVDARLLAGQTHFNNLLQIKHITNYTFNLKMK